MNWLLRRCECIHPPVPPRPDHFCISRGSLRPLTLGQGELMFLRSRHHLYVPCPAHHQTPTPLHPSACLSVALSTSFSHCMAASLFPWFFPPHVPSMSHCKHTICPWFTVNAKYNLNCANGRDIKKTVGGYFLFCLVCVICYWISVFTKYMYLKSTSVSYQWAEW